MRTILAIAGLNAQTTPESPGQQQISVKVDGLSCPVLFALMVWRKKKIIAINVNPSAFHQPIPEDLANQ